MTAEAWFLFVMSIFAVVALAFCAGVVWQWFRRFVVAMAVLAAPLLVPGIAWAQDADLAGAVSFVNVGDVSGAVAAGKYALAVVVILSGLLRFFRGPVLKRMPAEWKFVQWCQSVVGGWVLNFATSELAAISGYLATAAPVTAAGVISAVLGGVALTFTGAGAHEFAKDVTPAKAPTPAPVVTPTQAASVLELPPKDGQ